jgi:hypothetical protein
MEGHSGMTPYANLGGDSGVVGYDTGPDFIVVYFQDGSAYRYTERSAGRAHIATMQRLAQAGQGLNAYPGFTAEGIK